MCLFVSFLFRRPSPLPPACTLAPPPLSIYDASCRSCLLLRAVAGKTPEEERDDQLAREAKVKRTQLGAEYLHVLIRRCRSLGMLNIDRHRDGAAPCLDCRAQLRQPVERALRHQRHWCRGSGARGRREPAGLGGVGQRLELAEEGVLHLEETGMGWWCIAWPLQYIAIASIVWCMANTRGVGWGVVYCAFEVQ